MSNPRFLAFAGITLAAATVRLIPHPPNFTPLAAMALFGGAHFADKRAAFAVPLMAMYASDLFLGFFVYDFGWFHGSMPVIYGSFAVVVCLGLMIRAQRTPLAIGAAAVSGSLLFFVATNFAVWLAGALYPRTFEGLFACYVAAIPFFWNTLAGDALYTFVLFGGFVIAERCCAPLRVRPALES
ncbi:MAG: DUF6580 family putative transport protein [Pirellulales bacterium]